MECRVCSYGNIRCCCDVLMGNIHSLYPVICKLIFKKTISLIFHAFKYRILWDIYLICSGLLYMFLQSCLNTSYLALLVSFFSRVLPYRTPKFFKLILCCCCCISSAKHFVFVLELGLAAFVRAFHYVSEMLVKRAFIQMEPLVSLEPFTGGFFLLYLVLNCSNGADLLFFQCC